MTTTPDDPTTALPGRPPVVDLATWQTARDELLVREKAYTREGDALAAARRRLPMVELDGTVEVVGPDGPVPFLDLFQGRDELVAYKHMWYDGAPHQGQCEGCTTTAWHVKDAVYLNARGVSFAVLTTGRWDEVASYVEFMGYAQPWYSVRGVEAPVGGSMGSIACFPRDGDRVFLTYSTTGRGNEPVNGSLGLLDMTPYGRGEAWEDNPEGWPVIGDVREGHPSEGRQACWYWRSDADGVATWGPTNRPVPQWTRPGATPVETLGRHGHHHRRAFVDGVGKVLGAGRNLRTMRGSARAFGRWAVRPEGEGLLVGEGLSRLASPTWSPGARIVQVPVLVMPCSWPGW